LVPVAVKVTGVPWHTGFAEAVIETLTVRLVSTRMTMGFEFAGLFVAQVRSEVKRQVT
jgi:hypothetical protein